MQKSFVHDTDSIYWKYQSTTGKKLLAALLQAPEAMAVQL